MKSLDYNLHVFLQVTAVHNTMTKAFPSALQGLMQVCMEDSVGCCCLASFDVLSVKKTSQKIEAIPVGHCSCSLFSELETRN